MGQLTEKGDGEGQQRPNLHALQPMVHVRVESRCKLPSQ